MANPFEAFLFRGRSSNLTNINRERVPPAIVVDVDDDSLWQTPERDAGRVPVSAAIPPRASTFTLSQQDDILLGMADTPPSMKPPPSLPSAVSVSRHPTLIAQLPWSAKLSHERKEKIIELFEAQFCNYLIDNPVALKAFEPFISTKYLHRHANPKVILEEAPAIDATHIRCQPGHSLRDYQVEGVRFLLDNFHKGMSSILADDMGLGKTAQVCSFLQVLNTVHGIKGPHLIVVPLSTITNWMRELARWAPSLTLLKYHGSKDYRVGCGLTTEHRHSVVVTTPSTLVNEKDALRSRAWATLIVDEAHVLKTESTNIVHVCSKITAAFRLSITGTPFQNNLGEMWTQMSVLFPYIASKRLEMDEDDEVEVASVVKSLLSYIMLRRTKAQMNLGLPPRIDEPTMMIEPTPLQRRLLAAVREVSEKQGLYANAPFSSFSRLLMDLRKICNHPMLLKLLADPARVKIRATPELSPGIARLQSAGVALSEEDLILPSAKMIKLDHMLAQLKRDGHRCLIFSNFTSQLDILEGLCALRGHAFERLDGGCTRVERELSIARFNNKESKAFIFLVTTTAGGVGVTLTGADTVIIFDCHYNPQMDRQAADRAHRIGQTRNVYVYRMCLKGTAEENIQTISLRKEAMGDLVLDGERKRSDSKAFLSFDEIKKLLTMQQLVDDTDDMKSSSVVQELIQIVLDGKEEADDSAPGAVREVRQDFSDFRTNICFACGEMMKPLEPLKMCDSCPKGYHLECLDRPPGKSAIWTCPRHSCIECDKKVASDGAIFSCSSCPNAFCLDCLDPRYITALDSGGLALRDISFSYYGMKAEGVEVRRSQYYITCLKCSGIESSETETVSSTGEPSGEEVEME